MVTGRELARIVNQKLREVDRKFANKSGRKQQKSKDFVTVRTGGLKKIKKGSGKTHEKSNYHSNWVDILRECREFISQKCFHDECEDEDILSILEKFSRDLLSSILKSKNSTQERKYWAKLVYELLSKIESKSGSKTTLRKALRKSKLLHKIEITVKPWISLSGIPDTFVRVEDEFDFYDVEGKTDADGKLRTEALEGRNQIITKSEKGEKVEDCEIREDKSVTVHPSIL